MLRFGHCSFTLCHKTKQGLFPWLISRDIKDAWSKATALERCHFCCILLTRSKSQAIPDARSGGTVPTSGGEELEGHVAKGVDTGMDEKLASFLHEPLSYLGLKHGRLSLRVPGT